MLLLLGLNLCVKAQQPEASPLLELETKAITQQDFEQYKNTFDSYQPPILDSNGIIKALNAYLVTNCDEICESHLLDQDGKVCLLPSDYDSGILGLLFSPDAKQMIVYSSYDGPEYSNFYENRSEILIYEVDTTQGLKGIQYAGSYTTPDWSLEDLTWVNSETLALMVYRGSKTTQGVDGGYEYLSAKMMFISPAK
ncbi:hypothetical protein KFE98_14980 [bacterium SCSIO 12741]|nr:hypothetical protein KFE98_14980 [bacterium SCSIO 12741]